MTKDWDSNCFGVVGNYAQGDRHTDKDSVNILRHHQAQVVLLKGIVHYFTMSILKECAVNGHHNVGILSF